MADAPRTRILLAVTEDVVGRMERILAGHDLEFVRTGPEATAILNKEVFGLVVVSVHFDESQMFQVIGDIRAHAKYRKVPILCVLGARGRMVTDVAIEGLDHAVKAMRANGFLDFSHFAESEEANARIRRIADYLILIDGDLQHIARGERPVEGSIPHERRRAADNQ